MKKPIYILLIVILIVFLSNCSSLSNIESSTTHASAAESSGDDAPAASSELQAGSAVYSTPPDSSTTVSASAFADIPEQGTMSVNSPSSADSTAAPARTDLPNPTHEVNIPGPVPDYTTADNLWNNTLSTTYHSEQLASVYALDVKNHMTARYTLLTSMSSFDERYFAALLESAGDTPETGDRAFIVFTDKGRHYIYLDENASPKLAAVWEAIYNQAAPKTMHWLAHMTTEKISEIHFGGWSYSADILIDLTIKDRETIREISDFLKTDLTVDPDKPIEIFNGIYNPSTVAGHYGLTIKFDNGIVYDLMGYGDYGSATAGGSGISLYTSDLATTISYTLNERVARRLRDFMEGQQIGYWQKNGDPTRTTVHLLADSDLPYSKDVKVPLRKKNDSSRAITVTSDFFTQRRRFGGSQWEYIPFSERYYEDSSQDFLGDFSVDIDANSSTVIEIPFSFFDISDGGQGKYQTEFWVNRKFKVTGRYVLN